MRDKNIIISASRTRGVCFDGAKNGCADRLRLTGKKKISRVGTEKVKAATSRLRTVGGDAHTDEVSHYAGIQYFFFRLRAITVSSFARIPERDC